MPDTLRALTAYNVYSLKLLWQLATDKKADKDITMVRTKSGGNRAVSPEFIIRGMIFHPIRVKS
jgi:hypothetical protein